MSDGPRPLNLREVAEGLRSPHAPSARPRVDAPLLAASRTDEIARWLAGVQDRDVPRPLERVRLVVFAGDHGVHARGVSRLPRGWTAQAVRSLLDGTHPVAALAALAGVEVVVHAVGLEGGPDAGLDAGSRGGTDAQPLPAAVTPQPLPAAVTAHAVRGRSGDIGVEDAMTEEETEAAVRAGAAVADAEVDAGVDLLVLGDLGAGATTVAAALVAACLRKGAVDVVGRGSGIDDDAWMRKTAAIRDAVRRSRKLATRPVALLQAASSPDVAAAVGFLLRAAARRTPVLLDGVVGVAAALVAARGVPGAEKWWLVGAATAEPAQALAADRLKLTPVLDLGAGRGGGAGALTALGVLRAAQALAAVDEALLPPLPEPVGEPTEEPAREPDPEPAGALPVEVAGDAGAAVADGEGASGDDAGQGASERPST